MHNIATDMDSFNHQGHMTMDLYDEFTDPNTTYLITQKHLV